MDDKLAAWLLDHKTGDGFLSYSDKGFPYWIIEAQIEGMTYLAGYPDGERLFVSETVPAEYREFVLIHEIIEFQTRVTWPKRCLDASRYEATIFQIECGDANKQLVYWNFRVLFFRELIAFEERTNHWRGRIEGFKLSLAFFEGLQSRDWPT